MAIFLENQSPAPGATDVARNTFVSTYIVDSDSYVLVTTIEGYVDGTKIYDGATDTFTPPYDGGGSELTFLPGGSIDGYDAYQLTIDRVGFYDEYATVTIGVVADGYSGGMLDDYWSFTTAFDNYGAGDINILYFSDGYGLKAIELSDLTGESQQVVRTALDTTTTPAIPTNQIGFIHGTQIDGYNYLVLSMGLGDAYESYGAIIVKDEKEINTYRDGYQILKAQMNNDGTLYLINKNLNAIEVFYGADERSGTGRSPDYVYDLLSTPPILSGEIFDLHLVPGASNVATGASRFYVGTAKGATKVDTYDKESTGSPGFPEGLDGYGVSKTYGIVGSGAQFEVVGGTAQQVVEVSSDDDRLIMLVGTDDGYGNGGVTQIALSGDKKLLFMNKANSFLPSNTIKDIFGKGF